MGSTRSTRVETAKRRRSTPELYQVGSLGEATRPQIGGQWKIENAAWVGPPTGAGGLVQSDQWQRKKVQQCGKIVTQPDGHRIETNLAADKLGCSMCGQNGLEIISRAHSIPSILFEAETRENRVGKGR